MNGSRVYHGLYKMYVEFLLLYIRSYYHNYTLYAITKLKGYLKLSILTILAYLHACFLGYFLSLVRARRATLLEQVASCYGIGSILSFFMKFHCQSLLLLFFLSSVSFFAT